MILWSHFHEFVIWLAPEHHFETVISLLILSVVLWCKPNRIWWRLLKVSFFAFQECFIWRAPEHHFRSPQFLDIWNSCALVITNHISYFGLKLAKLATKQNLALFIWSAPEHQFWRRHVIVIFISVALVPIKELCRNYSVTPSLHDIAVSLCQQIVISSDHRLLCHVPMGFPDCLPKDRGPTGNMHRRESVSIIIGSLPSHGIKDCRLQSRCFTKCSVLKH